MNWPSPEPKEPVASMKVPFELNLETSWLVDSATYTSPAVSTSIPYGPEMAPGPVPGPHMVMKPPSESNFWMRLWP